MGQLLAHLWGDYILQSTWMALRKNKTPVNRSVLPCYIHVTLYTLPFLLLTRNLLVLAAIFASHYLIDRYSLARYLVWAKELMTNKDSRIPLRWAALTGYFDPEKAHLVNTHEVVLMSKLMSDSNVNRPIWIRVWLYIITDNALHLTCNYWAFLYLSAAYQHWLWKAVSQILGWLNLPSFR